MDQFSIFALLIIFFFLLIISAFFSISETSMMALNRYKMRHLASKGHHGATRTEKLMARTDRLLGVILLGNNLANAAAATLVTVIAIRLIGENEIALTLATLFVTAAILIFSEITPKLIGASYPEKIAYPASFLLRPLLKVAHPIVSLANIFVTGILWTLGLNPINHKKDNLSPEELRTLVLENGNFLPQKHKNILTNLFDLNSITVEDVMTPRSRIEAIDLNSNTDILRKEISSSNHTRIPLFSDQLDNVVGIVHLRKLLNVAEGELIDKNLLEEIMWEPYFVPIDTPLLTQLQNFQDQGSTMGLIVDEYGELMGLLTLEDIIEEIIGEFTTDSPLTANYFKPQEDGSIIANGGCPLRDLNKHLGFKFPLGGPKTINGLIVNHFQDIPDPGTSLKIGEIPVEILQAQDKVVKAVRLFPEELKKNILK
ncbi:MAG: magnesium and cobalt efflux protein CorC [Proteobacteria bacterium]|nr:magnesium and cobalt efflux protein CorC [Pseudomonadota bacterium]